MKKSLFARLLIGILLLSLLLTACSVDISLADKSNKENSENDGDEGQNNPPWFQWPSNDKNEGEESTTQPDDQPADTTAPAETQPTQTQPPETQPVERTDCAYQVSADGGLNVRTGPGTEHDTVGGLEEGEIIYPLRWVNHWAYIDGRLTGWCTGEFLEPLLPEEGYKADSQWVASSAPMYQGPGYNYNYLGNCQLSYGLRVYPKRWEGDWAYLEIQHYSGLLQGWVHADYLCQSDPEPIRRTGQFLNGKVPADQTLVGRWLVVSDFQLHDGGMASCSAGLLTLYSDGTFLHDMNYYIYNQRSGWGFPGGDDDGNASPLWAGEYTIKNQVLTLTYLGREINECVTDQTGWPMQVGVHWLNFKKTVVLKVAASDINLYVDAPHTIPVISLDAQGSATTDPVLYRVDKGQDVAGALNKYYN